MRIAFPRDSQRAVDEAAKAAVVRARGLLEARSQDRLEPGHKRRVMVEFAKGDVDAYVVLDAGQGSAIAVEFGHEAKDGSWVPGLGVLRDAFPRGKR